jgi:geranylgeranylglycerol-phosphate geranylgeranyltransferase
MRQFLGYFRLTRPLNLLITLLSIFLGGFVTGTIHPLYRLLLAALSGTFIGAGANVINDVFDVEIDKINKPYRPIASGLIDPKSAHFVALIFLITGIILSIWIPFPGILMASGSAGLLYLYSYRLKRIVLWSNITVAFIVGLAFVYGGLAVGRVGKGLVIGLFAFLYHLGREILKDIADMEGDRSQGVITLPIRYGLQKARISITSVLGLLIGLTFIPYFIHLFHLGYLIVVVIGVDLVLIYVIVTLWNRSDQESMERLSIIMKVNMFVGLLAFYIGR